MHMPVLETKRLQIRPFQMSDYPAALRLLDGEERSPTAQHRRHTWLQWITLNADQLRRLNQPPYGDRVIVLKENGDVIGVCGLVPSFGPFGLLPSWQTGQAADALNQPEMGLFWLVDPVHQGQGVATEAGQALIDFAFRELRLKRIVATTEHDNLPSQAVMRKLGMTLETNPYPEPAWFQVAGWRDHPDEE